MFKCLILTAVFIQQRHITNSSAAVFASSLFESVKWNVHKDPSVYEHKLKLTELLKVHVSQCNGNSWVD